MPTKHIHGLPTPLSKSADPRFSSEGRRTPVAEARVPVHLGTASTPNTSTPNTSASNTSAPSPNGRSPERTDHPVASGLSDREDSCSLPTDRQSPSRASGGGAGQLNQARASAQALGARFAADFAVQLPVLVGLPGLQPREKAERVLEFLAPYAEHLAMLEPSHAVRVAVATAMAAPILETGVLDQFPMPKGWIARDILSDVLGVELPDCALLETAPDLHQPRQTTGSRSRRAGDGTGTAGAPRESVAKDGPGEGAARTQAPPAHSSLLSASVTPEFLRRSSNESEPLVGTRRSPRAKGVVAWVSGIQSDEQPEESETSEFDHRTFAVAGVVVLSFCFMLVALLATIN